MNKRVLTKDYQTLKSELSINCNACSALCCVALYFHKTDGFPENKQAGVPCKYLQSDDKCKIYKQLESKHLKGCIAYDCFGAGQKTTQLLNNLGDIRKNTLKSDIYFTFEKLRLLNQILGYLLDVYVYCDETDKNQISQLIVQNREIAEMNFEDLIHKDIEEHRLYVNNFLKTFSQTYSLSSKYKLKNRIQLGKDLSKTNLDRADLSMSCLIASNLEECSFIGTNFLGADVRDVRIRNTDLSKCLFLTQIQVNSMIGNQKTKLPDGLVIPYHWLSD